MDYLFHIELSKPSISKCIYAKEILGLLIYINPIIAAIIGGLLGGYILMKISILI